MPRFDYKCLSCDNVFEKFINHNNKEEDVCCSKCGENNKIRMVPSGVSFNFTKKVPRSPGIPPKVENVVIGVVGRVHPVNTEDKSI
jgi:putative FmdB family regulatory protein